jgi:hypothetical protein
VHSSGSNFSCASNAPPIHLILNEWKSLNSILHFGLGVGIRALVLARVIHRALQSRSLMGAYSAAGYLVRMCPSFQHSISFLDVIYSERCWCGGRWLISFAQRSYTV